MLDPFTKLSKRDFHRKGIWEIHSQVIIIFRYICNKRKLGKNAKNSTNNFSYMFWQGFSCKYFFTATIYADVNFFVRLFSYHYVAKCDKGDLFVRKGCMNKWLFVGDRLCQSRISDVAKTQKTFPLPKVCHTHWVLLKLVFFYQKSATSVLSRNTDIDCILIVVSINMVTFLMSK